MNCPQEVTVHTLAHSYVHEVVFDVFCSDVHVRISSYVSPAILLYSHVNMDAYTQYINTVITRAGKLIDFMPKRWKQLSTRIIIH